ncbi:SMC-Scp complex subunit ScpB [Mycobacterium sp. smrl_JER01]|uniref:SMC-Scp complex subunit ScpB n=1 Tax=Mycobacterium sp. smrl_JER01 TaxID=3402633 RepID=UPI003AD2766A
MTEEIQTGTDERLREEQTGTDERLREEQTGTDERLREEQTDALDARESDDAELTGSELDDAELDSVLEALLLVVDTPVPVEALASATDQLPARVGARLQSLAAALSARDSGIELREAGGGWRLYTRSKFAPFVERLLLDGARSKLTRAALETLAVVAYRQPVTRARVSAVRGVNVDAVMRTLLARGLITEAGTDADSGAVTFATTELFLERLGLTALTDLPDIAPLLPDVDVIDDLSETLDDEPRFMKLNGAPAPAAPESYDVDRD